MRLIIGLGNPGLRYRSSRHNMGFLVIDKLSKEFSIRFRKKECSSLVGRGRSGGEDIVIAKPLTFMNLSGEAVKELIAKEALTLDEVIVVCDDADLKLGTIRMRRKGSSGGHNGLKSIIEQLGTEEFPRLRIGIGREEKGSLKGHVLAPFKKNDSEIINEIITRAVQSLNCWIKDGIEPAMTRFNA